MQASFELRAIDVSVCRKGKLILNNVSFTARPHKLTGIIGPNGAGKTTLMRALAGERPESGRVLINSEDLYDDPEYWLERIGYVPVDSVLHEHLTVWDALVYVGRLRRPNLTQDQIETKVDSLLIQFGFRKDDDRRHKQIRFLSSGERKRVNICSELITDPPILMLDEPTSGLDPDAEWFLMDLLRQYAHVNGQTILVITHTLNTVHFCDNVIFLENARKRGGRPPLELLADLEQQAGSAQPGTGSDSAVDPAGTASEDRMSPSVFERWVNVFKEYKTDEEERENCSRRRSDRRSKRDASSSHQTNPTPWSHQLRFLLGRYVRVRLGDRWGLIGTLLAGFSGILFFVLPEETFVKPFDPAEVGLALNQARQSIYLVSIIVVLIGLITSYTEISKEFHIYRHERLKGLSPSAYFMAKWISLAAAVGVLAPIILMLCIVLGYGQPLPGFDQPRTEFGEAVSHWEYLWRFQLAGLFTAKASWLIVITLILACIASVTLGLLISAMAGDSGKGYLYLSFVVVFIVLFSGLIQNEALERLVDLLAFASTGKWGYEGVASSLSIYCWLDGWRFDEFNSTGRIVSIWLSLIIYALVAAFLTNVALRMRDPWYRFWRNLKRILAQDWARIAVYVAILIVLLSFTRFLRHSSYEYHSLTYWSQGRYGGSNAYEYANVRNVQDTDILQLWNGEISQSWCGEP